MYIHIDSEEGISCSEKLTFEDSMRLLGTAIMQIMHDVNDHVRKTATNAEEYAVAHGRIYDMFNIMAGNILDSFDPGRSPYTDLTAEAILKAENAILEETPPSDESQDESPPLKLVEETSVTEEETSETESPA